MLAAVFDSKRESTSASWSKADGSGLEVDSRLTKLLNEVFMIGPPGSWRSDAGDVWWSRARPRVDSGIMKQVVANFNALQMRELAACKRLHGRTIRCTQRCKGGFSSTLNVGKASPRRQLPALLGS
jgi:hypothetical protein